MWLTLSLLQLRGLFTFFKIFFYFLVLDIFYLELLALSLVQAYLVLYSAHGLDLKNSLC